MKAERAVRKVILEQPALNTKVFSTSVFSPSSLSTEIFIFTVTATNLNGGKLELKDIRRVTYYSWGFKYHITNKGKNKPFPGVGQGLLNGRLLQSAAMDCTVHCNGLYSPLPKTVVIRRTNRHNRKDENAWSD